MTNAIKIKEEKVVTAERKKVKTEGFIRKFEKQIDFFFFFETVHYELSKKISDEHCPFCNSGGTSLRINLVRKTFSCSVCGLKGGLVLFVMLQHNISLLAALRYIIKNSLKIDVSIIPHHVLIPLKVVIHKGQGIKNIVPCSYHVKIIKI